MGWNDHFCPSEYDANDADSMLRLAARATRRASSNVPTKPKDVVGECWDCGATAKIVGKGMCGWCWWNDNM